ncbi:response regulator [Hydrogenophaga laconesensis]|uniref:Two-component system probable response regulator PhcQ n=1 Tax=Hydrogenophaga laconesensis TaxID=1805971 RepID=A0ABU1VG62_9BURK|nr:response regulator [Hydrogenophaga laconesensis]MDR7096308.1 two-component system probable response regulator PhcQ [Hydrogenophaga laconesensis]
MKPVKILYVDDEAMALKYFERLVGPLAPVLTASSVEEGKSMLAEHGAEVAVLVCDQRMPGEYGNELLRHAREYYPAVVRMLTTAYSELGDAIEAINTGEIYRYINKPWELESLRADLKNALELAELRSERDGLMRDKLMAQQGQLLASRLSALLMVGAAVHADGHEQAVHRFAQAALRMGQVEPSIDWHRWDHADLVQAEAQRGAAVAAHLRHWLREFGSQPDGAGALPVLAQALNGELQGDRVLVADAQALTALLSSPAGEAPTVAECAWLAWLLWQGGLAEVVVADSGWAVRQADAAALLPADWLADAIERLGRATA